MYDRDHTFLAWYEDATQATHHSIAKIRDKARAERPDWKVTAGSAGYALVKKAIQRARKEL